MTESENLGDWEVRFEKWLLAEEAADAAHGLSHILRVVANARQLAAETGALLPVVMPAAWLHDCVSVAKDSPLRSRASRMAAEKAGAFLRQTGYPDQYIAAIEHAIAAHSFTAAIAPQTLEAKVVQDADRLDSLGAIGIARCIMTGVGLGRDLYHVPQPRPDLRTPQDELGSVDHFYTKLLTLAGTMQTDVGRAEADKRTAFMRSWLNQLYTEIGVA